jgi:transposase InsO family protein
VGGPELTAVGPAVLGVGEADGELAAAGWKLQAVSTDNGSEFRSQEFRRAVQASGAQQRFIRAGRPQTNGCVERVQRTILEECWRPSFARSLVPKVTALQRDLVQYLDYYNFERAHTGLRSGGLTPAALVYGARKMRPR